MTWRAAHHWLRGYSDAKLGKDWRPIDDDYSLEYSDGYGIGRGRQ